MKPPTELILKTCPVHGTKHLVFHNWTNGGDLTFLEVESETEKVLRVVNEENHLRCTVPKKGLRPMGLRQKAYAGQEHYFPAQWFIDSMTPYQRKALGRSH